MAEIINYIKNNTNGFLAIAGALLTGLFGLGMYNRNKTRDFRRQLFEVFQPSLNRLLQTDDDCKLFLNYDTFKKHEIAVNNLMAHIDFIERMLLKRKWHRLCMVKVAKKHYMPDYEQYADCGSLDKRRKVRPVVIKRIQDITSFANK